MPGHAADWAFSDIAPITSVRVVSYGEFVSEQVRCRPRRDADASSTRRQLQAIGHLNDPTRNLTPVLEDEDQTAQRAAAPLSPEQWGPYAYYNNLGIQLRAKGKLKEADRGVQTAPSTSIRRARSPHLNLAMALFDRQQYTRRRRELPEGRGARPAERGALVHRLRRALPRAQHDLARHRAAVQGDASSSRSRT